MRMRYFYRAGTGQWCAAAFGSAGDFSVPWEQHAKDVAAAIGLAATELEAIEVEDGPDPRTGTLLAPPPVPETADAAELRSIAALLAKADADLTAAEVRTLVLRALRRLQRRGALS